MEKTFKDGQWEGEGKLPVELTEDENKFYEEKAEMLAKANNVSKVHVVVQMDPDTLERKVCYLKEPNYMTKITTMDKTTSHGMYFAADQLREASVIKEASDAITYGDGPECDRYKLGVTNACIDIVTLLQNQFKKK